MKRIIAAIIIILLLLTISGIVTVAKSRARVNYMKNHWYPQCGIITSIDRTRDTMTITDSTGNRWIWEGVEDFQLRDHVSMVMDDNNSDFVLDDKIVKIYYMGVY